MNTRNLIHSTTQPMRILMLAQFYPPVIGGEETHVHSLCHGLRERGHDVSVITLAHGDLPAVEDDDGVRIFRVRSTTQRTGSAVFQTVRQHAPPFPDPAIVQAIQAHIAAERPQIVHGHNWILHSFIPLKRWSRAKFVVSLHDYSLRCSTKKLMFMEREICSGPAVRKCFQCSLNHYGIKGPPVAASTWTMGIAERRSVDIFLPVSHAVAEGNGILDNRVNYRIIPNFIADNTAARAYPHFPQLDALPDEPFILFVGDLNATKGADVAVQAYAGIPDAPPLVLIGREFPETPKDLPPNVRILKSLPHDAVMQAFQRSLFTLVPSRWAEPFGIVVIEALVFGRPVIAARSGGIPEIIVDGESGFLVPPGDVEAMRDRMCLLLADAGRREQMGIASAQRATAYYASSVVPQFEQVYRELLAS